MGLASRDMVRHGPGVDPHDIELVRSPDADRWGDGRRSLARDAERGCRTRVRRGVYADATTIASLSARDRHLLEVRALATTSASAPVFSHRSAAVLLGLPLLSVPSAIDVTMPPDGVRKRHGVRAYGADLDEDEVRPVRGLLVTSAARTVCDVARTAPFEEAVVILDAFLHTTGPSGRVVLEAAVRDSAKRRGGAALRRAVVFADGGSESPGESVSRVTMAKIGVRPPVLQHVFTDRFGRFIARGDFWFPLERVLGEMDGRMKYVDPALTGGDPGEVVYREKRREDEVRASGIRVVRWDWQTARDPTRLAAVLAEAGVHPVAR